TVSIRPTPFQRLASRDAVQVFCLITEGSMRFCRPALVICCLFGLATTANADVRVFLPLNRSAFQTNEWIDISVVRSGVKSLNGDSLDLTLHGADGSKIAVAFPVAAVEAKGNEARSVEHFHVNGWLLRPGKYKVEVTVDGSSASTEIEVYSH